MKNKFSGIILLTVLLFVPFFFNQVLAQNPEPTYECPTGYDLLRPTGFSIPKCKQRTPTAPGPDFVDPVIKCPGGYYLTTPAGSGKPTCLKEAELPTELKTQQVTGFKTTLEIPCDERVAPEKCPQATTPAGYVARIYQFSLMAVGLLAMGALVFGAVKYILSAGSIVSQQDAKDQIKAAISGLLILLGAYLILRTINPDLVNLRNPTSTPIKLEEVGGASTAQPGKKNTLTGETGTAPTPAPTPTTPSPPPTGGTPLDQVGCINPSRERKVTINGKEYWACNGCNVTLGYRNESGICKK